MVQYYILVKRKGSKKWSGAIPSKKGVTLSKLKTNVKKQIKKGYTYKITNQTGLRKIFANILKQKLKKKLVKRTRQRKKSSKGYKKR